MHCRSTGRFVRLLQRRCFLPLHRCQHRSHCHPSWAIGAVSPKSRTSSRPICREKCPAARCPDDEKVQGPVVKKRPRAGVSMSSRGEGSWVNPHFAVTAPQPRPSSPLQPALTALTQSCEAEGFQVEGSGFFRLRRSGHA